MTPRNRERSTLQFVVLALCATPLMLGGDCFQMDIPPPPPGSTTLLQRTVTSSGGLCDISTACGGATNVLASNDVFAPTATGKVITATVTASLTNSRPQFEIRDAGTVFANSGVTPTTNTATASFTSISNEVLDLDICECNVESPEYTILITQAP